MAVDDESPWYRSLLVGVGAMLGAALIVGAVVSAVALGAVNVAGLGSDGPSVQAEPSLHIPEPSAEGGGAESPSSGETAQGGDGRRPEAKAEPKKRKPPQVVSLSATPLEVSSMERIYLTGTYPRGDGASLQVQRFEGGWSDFPTTTSVSGGTFSTYIMTGRAGPNRFRVVDPATGKASNPVTVTVR